MTEEAWYAAVHGVTELDTTERLKGTELTVCPDGLPLEGAPLPGISKVILSLVK